MSYGSCRRHLCMSQFFRGKGNWIPVGISCEELELQGKGKKITGSQIKSPENSRSGVPRHRVMVVVVVIAESDRDPTCIAAARTRFPQITEFPSEENITIFRIRSPS